jgi:hypothetical protein
MSEQKSTKYARIAMETNNENVRDEALAKWYNASKKEGKSWFLGQPLMLPTGQINLEFFLRLFLFVLILPIILAGIICKAIHLRGAFFLFKIPIFLLILALEILLIIFLFYGFSGDFQTALPKTFNFVVEFISTLKK